MNNQNVCNNYLMLMIVIVPLTQLANSAVPEYKMSEFLQILNDLWLKLSFDLILFSFTVFAIGWPPKK